MSAAERPERPAKPSRRREATKQETRAALVSAALAEFVEKGFDVPSLDGICARAGFTRGAFYVHFRSRDELVEAVMDRVLTETMEGVLGGEEPADLTTAIDRWIVLATGGRPILGGPAAPPTPDGERAEILFHQMLEATERLPAVRERLTLVLTEAAERLAKTTGDDQARGLLRNDVAARDVANILMLLALGLRVANDVALPVDVESGKRALFRLLELGGRS